MNQKKTFWSKVEEVLTGKGFYIVLFICVAVIGVSAWALLFTDSTFNDSEDGSISSVSSTPSGNDIGEITDNHSNDQDDVDSSLDEGEDAMAEISATPTPTATPTPENSQDTIEDIMFIWPLSGEIEVDYSVDELIYNKTMADWRTHAGIDISALLGTKVMAAAAGKVLDVYEDEMYGTTVVIDHGLGLCSVYSNLAATPTVEIGDSVSMGDTIGSVGDTAIAETGEVAHLHYAMTLDGDTINPMDYLPNR